MSYLVKEKIYEYELYADTSLAPVGAVISILVSIY